MKSIAKKARKLAKPKGLYKTSFIDEKGKNYIIMEDKKFSSQILRDNLDSAEKVYPYIVTCGKELEKWSRKFKDNILMNYYVDVIKNKALNIARKELKKDIKNNKFQGKISKMNPGSLPNWPISEQKKLFALFNNVKKKIDVKLNDNYLMYPVKSASGLWFPSEVKFENCQLCTKKNCPNRKAKFDKKQYMSYIN